MKKRIVSLILSITMMMGMTQGLAVKAAGDDNLAKNKTATSSSNETNNMTAAKAFDDNSSTRWASRVGDKPAWLKVDLGASKTVGSAVISFRRKNASAFTIDTSTDGTTWTAQKTYSAYIPNNTLIANFDAPVSARYVRVNITEYSASQDTGPDGGNNWNAVSINEFEIYAGAAPIKASMVAESINFVQPTDTATAITFPTLSAEYAAKFNLEFVGADYEQLIAQNGTIYRPLVDTQAIINFKVINKTNEKDYVITPNIAITLKGTGTGAGSNPKPKVIPELREWLAGTGNVTLDTTSRIIVDSAVTGEKATSLLAKANIFKEDYKFITGREIAVVTAASGNAKDLFMTTVTTDVGLGDEGYRVTTSDTGIKLEGFTTTGVFWATRTVLQILAQDATKSNLPKGTVRDYPRFKARGFMYDVGRRGISMQSVEDVAKMMSWYKMNDFQLHLNDNYIFVGDWQAVANRKYPGNDTTDRYNRMAFILDSIKAGFRIESNIIGPGGPVTGTDPVGQSTIVLPSKPLHSEDYYYTKAEFKEFTNMANEYGVDIIPEFDTPAHAAALVKAFPQLRYKSGNYNFDAQSVAMLDATNPAAKELATRLFSEYILKPDGTAPNGKDEVFTGDVVHVGSDEFYGDNEDYRNYADFSLDLVQKLGKTPRIWGSLSHKPGTTPVRAKGVQLSFWNTGYSNPKDMYDMGYDMINIRDGVGYMVPSGSGSVGGYGDRINTDLFKNFTPNNYGGHTIPAGDKQALGGAFALWQDNCDLKANGLTELDYYERIREGLIIFSEQNWSMPNTSDKADWNELNTLSKTIGVAPNTNPTAELKSKGNTVIDYTFNDADALKDTSTNDYNAVSLNNATVAQGKDGKGIALSGGNSSVELPVTKMGPNYTATMWVNRSSAGGNDEQVLLENRSRVDNPDKFTMFVDQFKAVQKESGKVGFSREGYDYSFDYTLPTDQWVKLTLVAEMQKTALYVNDRYISEVSLAKYEMQNANAKVPQAGTFVLPLERIGSKTNSFVGLVDSFKVEKTSTFTPVVDDKGFEIFPKFIEKDKMFVTPSRAGDQTGSELLSYLFDGTSSASKMWHSKIDLPMPRTLYFGWDKSNSINSFTIKSESSGHIGKAVKNYSIWTTNQPVTRTMTAAQLEALTWTKQKEGVMPQTPINKLDFAAPVDATSAKLVITSSYKNNAEVAITEIDIGVATADNSVETAALKAVYDANIAKMSQEYNYTVASFTIFSKAMTLAKNMMDDGRAGGDQLTQVKTALEAANTGLVAEAVRSAPPIISKSLPSLLSAYKDESFLLSVDASGSAVSYKWYKNGALLPDKTTKDITVNGESAIYSVEISNTDTGRTANTIELTVSVAADIMRGDVNSNRKIDLTDALLSLKIATGVKTDANDRQLKAANMAKETTISSASVSKILEKVVE